MPTSGTTSRHNGYGWNHQQQRERLKYNHVDGTPATSADNPCTATKHKTPTVRLSKPTARTATKSNSHTDSNTDDATEPSPTTGKNTDPAGTKTHHNTNDTEHTIDWPNGRILTWN